MSRRDPRSTGLARKPTGTAALACLGSGSFLAHDFDALQREFKSFPSELRAVDDLLDVAHELRIAELFAQFLEERMYLGEEEIHFSADRGLKKQVGIERSIQSE